MKKLFSGRGHVVSRATQTATHLFYLLIAAGFFITLIGCQSIPEISFVTPTETPLPVNTATATVPPTSTITPIPPTETPPPPTLTATPSADLSLIPSQISVYPVPQLYAGDLATFQVTANVPSEIPLNTVDVDIYLNGEFLVRRELDSRNLGGQARAIIEWAWDTENALGDYTITMILDPDDKITVGDEDEENNRHELELSVLPNRARPLAETEAQWITTETDQAYVHVVAGTAAERDLRDLLPMVDQAITHATETLQEQPKRKFDVYFVDRVIGQGGYAGNSMVVSYLDRNYSGGDIYTVLVHEAIHLLDRQFVGNGRLNFLAEGVAVWGTGGHYKPEDLQGKAKALVDTDLYIPLDVLIDDFYPVQHEIGYLQAGAFIDFLVAQYGWPTVREFYAAVDIRSATSRSLTVDGNLQRFMGKSLAQLEQEWLASLVSVDASTAEQDLLGSVRFYNIMRQYQIQYDPTAHFLNAWLPRPNQLREQGLTAELNRHPTADINLILETMLTEADAALRNEDFQQTNVLLNSVERVLSNNGLAADPLSKGYFDIVSQASEWGYEVHRIEIDASNATVLATNPYSPNLLKLTFGRNQHGWFMLQ